MTTPVIGITTYREQARWGVWDERADVLHAAYADIVSACGGAPVLLPPAAPEHAATVLGRVDGLVVAGGADVDPAAYGQPAHPAASGWRPDRDAWELALVAAAREQGVPLLGVCRGMQLLAVAGHGSLQQHLPDVVGHDEHSPGGPDFGTVSVSVAPGSRTSALVGGSLDVTCHHHQSVVTHPGLEAVAWAEDGTVEAVEAPGDWFCVGVQWHPETTADVGLVAGLVTAAAAHRDAMV
ncbi:gamma-glutamyl-gamma-aminobutyrate hydrolase family protein [Nocardioides aestuarii]|uniref:Gamma-glutamyl-gamma-aminobutyrate hydrolase family protein n=1 Tax=Nocardioides aestuarii TaxID=252231 RepID=A0ABW4TU65_9ACTN